MGFTTRAAITVRRTGLASSGQLDRACLQADEADFSAVVEPISAEVSQDKGRASL
jgi:hypothetical protein